MIRAIKNFLWKVYFAYAKVICKVFPYSLGPSLAKWEYRRLMGRKMDLQSPRDLIEKIVWMQFHTDTSLWTQRADKYAVRQYVTAKMGGGNILPKLYGHWDDANQIDFERLPNSFVLKTNNSCGQVILVRDKYSLDVIAVRRTLNSWLRQHYGSHNAQLHYLRIKPCIIAEELLVDPSLKQGEALLDYKIWCFNGEPECTMVVNGRKGHDFYVSFYDIEWNNISDKALNPKSPHFGGLLIERPKGYEKMLELARRLSSGFPQVRVDFYDIDGKIYFGELTFTTGYGYCSKEYYDYLGSKIDLTKIKRKR